MARPNKEGLDYFTLDCCLNDKIKLIEAEFGLKGFAVVVKLYMKIYKERGYYCEWNDDVAFLFMADMGGNSCVDKKLIDEIVAASIRRGIFSKQLYDDFGILTSKRVQEQYFEAVSRREKVEVKKEYLLVEVRKNMVSVDKNQINVNRNSKNESSNTQSRVEKNISVYDNTRVEPCIRFDEFWNLYPKQKNRFLAEQEYAVLISSTKELTEEQLLSAVKNYAESCQIKKTREQYIKNPENWLKDSIWVDYLPENYQRPAKADTGNKGSRNKFNNFPQRSYNYDELEKQLLNAKG